MLKNGEARKFVDDAITEQGVEFEVRGWDVVVRGPDWLSKPLSIELKPQIGDDYPAILRTMKGRVGSNSRALSSSTVSKLKAQLSTTLNGYSAKARSQCSRWPRSAPGWRPSIEVQLRGSATP